MDTVDLLNRPTYLYSEVDRLVGLRQGTARRWINGYERSVRSYQPILRTLAEDTEWATWGEFVETRMLMEFRDHKVPTIKLRAAVEALRDRFGSRYPLAYFHPYLAAEDGELALNEGELNPGTDGGLSVVRTGQLILQASRPVINTATLLSDPTGEKYAVEIVLDPSFPGIKANPGRLSGQPTVEGRRVGVAMIAGMVAAGEPRENIAGSYRLSLAQVDAAVQYATKHDLAA